MFSGSHVIDVWFPGCLIVTTAPGSDGSTDCDGSAVLWVLLLLVLIIMLVSAGSGASDYITGVDKCSV